MEFNLSKKVLTESEVNLIASLFSYNADGKETRTKEEFVTDTLDDALSERIAEVILVGTKKAANIALDAASKNRFDQLKKQK